MRFWTRQKTRYEECADEFVNSRLDFGFQPRSAAKRIYVFGGIPIEGYGITQPVSRDLVGLERFIGVCHAIIAKNLQASVTDYVDIARSGVSIKFATHLPPLPVGIKIPTPLDSRSNNRASRSL